MAMNWKTIPGDMQAFISEQKVFFVATSPREGRVNLSPKGLDTLRILDEKTVAYLDLTGSGNETAAHVHENGRMTIMFCALNGAAMILRLYGVAELIRPNHADFDWLLRAFPRLPGARQIFRLNIDHVSNSCGWSIPIVGEITERHELLTWAEGKGEQGMEAYRLSNNLVSIDGLSTGYVSDDF